MDKALKNIPFKLNETGKNYRSWAHGAESLIRAQKMLPCYRLKAKEKLLNPIENPAQCREITKFTKEEAKEYFEAVPKGETEAEVEKWTQLHDQAFAMLNSTVHQSHSHLLEKSNRICALAWSIFSEKFNPTDQSSKYDLYNKIAHEISIMDHKGDVDKYSAEIARTANRLRQMGSTIDEDLMIMCLINGLKPPKRFKSVRYSMATQSFPSFQRATESLKDLCRTKDLLRKEDEEQLPKDKLYSNEEINQDDPNDQMFYQMWRPPYRGRGRGRGRRGRRGNGRGGRRGRGRGRRGRRGTRGYGRGRKRPYEQIENESARLTRASTKCFVCGRFGHYARECWYRNEVDDKTYTMIQNKIEQEKKKKFLRQQQEDDEFEKVIRKRYRDEMSDSASDKISVMKSMSAALDDSESKLNKELDPYFCHARFPSEEANEILAVASNCKISKRPILDCGATNNVFCEKKWFAELKILPIPKTILVGNGDKIIAKHAGTAMVKFKTTGETLKFPNSLYAPDSHVNVLSQRKFDLSGFKTIGERGQVKIFQNRKLIAIAKLADGLYKFHCEPHSSAKQNEKTDEVRVMKGIHPYVMLHRRLDHASKNKMKQTLQASLGHKRKIRLTNIPCAACDLTTTKRARRGRHDEASREPERIHADAKKIGFKSVRGYKYLVPSCT